MAQDKLDVAALFDRLKTMPVTKAMPTSRRAVKARGEWNEFAMAAVFAGEIEERRQWTPQALVLLRQMQRCLCGAQHEGTFGVFIQDRRKGQTGVRRLRQLTAEDHAIAVELPRREEWMADQELPECPECFFWGQPQRQRPLAFDAPVVPAEVAQLVSGLVADLEHTPHTSAPQHNLFGTGGLNERRAEDASTTPADSDSEAGPGSDDGAPDLVALFATLNQGTRSDDDDATPVARGL